MQSNKINSFINKKLKEISRNNQFRKIYDVQRRAKNQITINGKNAISFSCNDYLGLSLNRSVIKSAEAVPSDIEEISVCRVEMEKLNTALVTESSE